MKHHSCGCTRAWFLSFTMAACLIDPSSARGQDVLPALELPAAGQPVGEPGAKVPAAEARPSLVKPFVDGLGDIRRLPSWQNAAWLTAGLGAAAAVRPADTSVTHEFSEVRTDSFRPGQFVGYTPVQLAGAFATYAFGRANDQPRVMAVGSDLIRAQVVADLVTLGVKQTVRRTRPDGGNYSFPSGHASVTFASATVLQKHFGWKVGVPAYAVASYVAASRVQMKRHFLSDVAFGATIGIVAGRTVTVGRSHKVMLSPMAAPGGGGISFTWLGKN